MTLQLGRLGSISLGIESAPGTPVSATTSIPFITNSFQGKHKPIEDISVRASRAQNFSSVMGQKWSEGEVEFNIDSLNVGFFLKLATGNENLNTIQTGVYDHLFYTTTSGNTPLTATMYVYQGVDYQKFASVCVDKIDFSIKDALMTAKASLKGFFPTSASTTAPTTVSGTVFSFGSYNLKFGSSLIAAASAAAQPVTDFSLSINNNADVVFESGQPNASRVFWKQLQITGTWTQYFETASDRDSYLAFTKESAILTASGIALAGGNNESLTFNFAKLAYTDNTIDTGIDNFFAIKTSFVAEVDPLQAKQFDTVLRNYRSTVYA